MLEADHLTSGYFVIGRSFWYIATEYQHLSSRGPKDTNTQNDCLVFETGGSSHVGHQHTNTGKQHSSRVASDDAQIYPLSRRSRTSDGGGRVAESSAKNLFRVRRWSRTAVLFVLFCSTVPADHPTVFPDPSRRHRHTFNTNPTAFSSCASVDEGAEVAFNYLRRQAANGDSFPVTAQQASSHKSHDRFVLLSKRTQFAKVKAKQRTVRLNLEPATLQRQRDDRRSQQVCRTTPSRSCRQRGCESPV